MEVYHIEDVSKVNLVEVGGECVGTFFRNSSAYGYMSVLTLQFNIFNIYNVIMEINMSR